MTTTQPDLQNLLAAKNSYQLEALLCLHQVEAIEEANAKTRKAFSIVEKQAGGGLDSLLLTSPRKQSPPIMLHMAEEVGVDAPPRTLADDLTDQDEDENTSLHNLGGDESDEESISHSLREDPHTPLAYLHDSNSSSILSNNTNSPRNVSRGETHPTQAKKLRPSELENTSHADLQEEVLRLRETVQMCYRSLVSVQQNADVKLQQLQLKCLFLERKLADEQAITSKLSVSNQSLRRELQAAFVQAKEEKDTRKCRKMVHLHQRELTVEKHLNSLLMARNQAVKQNTTLKRMLLQTCTDCRSQLPLKKSKTTSTAKTKTTPQTPAAATPTPSQQQLAQQASFRSPQTSYTSLDMSTPSLMTPRVLPEVDSRPTWQSSTRSVLNKLSQEAANESQASLPEDGTVTPRASSSSSMRDTTSTAQRHASNRGLDDRPNSGRNSPALSDRKTTPSSSSLPPRSPVPQRPRTAASTTSRKRLPAQQQQQAPGTHSTPPPHAEPLSPSTPIAETPPSGLLSPSTPTSTTPMADHQKRKSRWRRLRGKT